MSEPQKYDDITSLAVLQEKRNDAVKRIGELRDKFHSRGDKEKNQPGSWEGEEKGQWEAVNADLKLIDARRDKLRSSEEIEKVWQAAQEKEEREHHEAINNPETGQGPVITPEVRALAFQAWLAKDSCELSKRQQDALDLVKVANKKQLSFRTANTEMIREAQELAQTHHRSKLKKELKTLFSGETRAMGTGAGVGGEFIPEGFVRQVEVNMLAFGSVMQAGDILRTASGNDLPWPTFDDTGNTGRQIPEADPVAPVDPSTSNIVLKAYKYTSDEILVSYELLEDEDIAPELPVILGAALGERIGRIKESKYTNGTGTDEAQGIVTASALGVTAASATAITSDEIIQLEHSVDPAYRSGASYMMHDSVILAVRLLKDLNGQYFWQPGLQMGVPDRLNGRQVYTNQEMESALATGNKVMLFGDLTKHKIREVNDIRMYRLVERHRENDQDAFLAFSRGDSRLLNAGTNPVKHLIMA